jgi:hypothetical protein
MLSFFTTIDNRHAMPTRDNHMLDNLCANPILGNHGAIPMDILCMDKIPV